MTKRGAKPPAAALPPCCFARSPLTGETIGLIRGGNGYCPVISRDTPEALNATLPNPPTLAQVQAMLAGAVFGWDVAAADPAGYVAPAGSQLPEPECFRRLPEPPYGIEDWGAPDRPVQLADGATMHPRPTHLPDPIWILSGADLGFHGWLALVDVRIAATSPWTLLTLPVRDWREQYDGRVPPDEAADVAVDEHASVHGIPDDRDGYPPACSDPGGHSWVAIDDTDRCYCEHCRADGDGRRRQPLHRIRATCATLCPIQGQHEEPTVATFPAIEAYRAELRATPYTPLDDAELARIRQRYADAHHSSAIEDIHPSAEQLAFDALMIELRVPRDLARRYSDRFSRERIVGPALARQKAVEAGKLRA